jgi:DNA sulfur modification protein DndB
MTAGEVRRDFIHSHAIVLQALGRIGRAIYQLPKPNLSKALAKLKHIDWSRKNAQTWEGRAMIGGSMSKAGQNIVLTTIEIKRVLGLSLTSEEQVAENALQARIPSKIVRKNKK